MLRIAKGTEFNKNSTNICEFYNTLYKCGNLSFRQVSFYVPFAIAKCHPRSTLVQLRASPPAPFDDSKTFFLFSSGCKMLRIAKGTNPYIISISTRIIYYIFNMVETHRKILDGFLFMCLLLSPNVTLAVL
jgi:hypothetical protein